MKELFLVPSPGGRNQSHMERQKSGLAHLSLCLSCLLGLLSFLLSAPLQKVQVQSRVMYGLGAEQATLEG